MKKKNHPPSARTWGCSCPTAHMPLSVSLSLSFPLSLSLSLSLSPSFSVALSVRVAHYCPPPSLSLSLERGLGLAALGSGTLRWAPCHHCDGIRGVSGSLLIINCVSAGVRRERAVATVKW